METPLKIQKIDVPVRNGKAELQGDGIYIVNDGKVVKYPLPEFGTVKIKSHNSKVDHPEYTMFAEK
ncbi:MAG: hypothetical protein ABF497_05530 [Sporolactobacillus sp.]